MNLFGSVFGGGLVHVWCFGEAFPAAGWRDGATNKRQCFHCILFTGFIDHMLLVLFFLNSHVFSFLVETFSLHSPQCGQF